jgi:hypothetical protein
LQWIELTLAYQEPNANAGQVEAIKPSLDVETDVLRLLVLLPLEHALGDGCHSRVMTPLDRFERLGETGIIVVDLGRPLGVGSSRIIPTSENQLCSQRERERYYRPFLDRNSEPASIDANAVTIANATVRAFLKIWRRHGK